MFGSCCFVFLGEFSFSGDLRLVTPLSKVSVVLRRHCYVMSVLNELFCMVLIPLPMLYFDFDCFYSCFIS